MRRYDIMSPANSLESAVNSFESAGRSVLDRLGVAEDPMVGADPVALLRSLAAAGGALVKTPAATAAASGRPPIGRAAATRAAAARRAAARPSARRPLAAAVP